MPANNFRLPAEWEPQSGVMLTWPHADTDWADTLEQTLPVFQQIGVAISRDGILLSVCRDPAQQQAVEALLLAGGAVAQNLRFAIADNDDTWARDFGAISVLAGDSALLNDFQFDAWGGKFPAEADNRINRALAAQGCFGDTPLHTRTLVLEGGALETDGRGSLLATRSSVLDPQRNPGLSDADVEQQLRELLGIERFLWLDNGGLLGDDTDAHVDVLARFADQQTIIYSSAPEGDADHPRLQAMQRELESLRDAEGKPYRLRPLPFPGIHQDEDGRRLPASYANFLITNQSVLLPVYGVEQDQQAIEVLRECFPGRRIVPVDCRPIIRQNGSLHCLTMQFPAQVSLQNAAHSPS